MQLGLSQKKAAISTQPSALSQKTQNQKQLAVGN
jgi:hypothetical protein